MLSTQAQEQRLWRVRANHVWDVNQMSTKRRVEGVEGAYKTVNMMKSQST